MDVITQELMSAFFDDDALRLPPIRLYRLDSGDTRLYYTYDIQESLTIFSGVTGMLDAVLPTPQWLIEWIARKGIEVAEAYKQERAVYGTLFHTQAAQLLLKGAVSLDTLADDIQEYCYENGYPQKHHAWVFELSKDLLAFAQWTRDVNFRPLGIEVPLCSQEFRVASCVDLWGKADLTVNRHKVDDAMIIVDLKSGKNSSTGNVHHSLQLAYYQEMVKENYPEFAEIDCYLFNWHPKQWKGSPTYHFTNQTGKHTREELSLYSRLFHLTHDLGAKTRLALQGEISLSQPIDGNFHIQSCTEFLEEDYHERTH